MQKTSAIPLFLAIAATFQFAAAQFDFFGNMFGYQQQQQQRSGASQWAAYSDSVSCPMYLCPETLDCVAKPVECPCPYPEDIKCLIPDDDGGVDDATVLCTRGQADCREVELLMRKGGSPNSRRSKSKAKK